MPVSLALDLCPGPGASDVLVVVGGWTTGPDEVPDTSPAPPAEASCAGVLTPDGIDAAIAAMSFRTPRYLFASAVDLEMIPGSSPRPALMDATACCCAAS